MTHIIRRAGAAALIMTALGWHLRAQTDTQLAVGGDVAKPLTLTAADLKGMPRTTVALMDQGRDVKYSGVLVGEILARAGAPLGRDMSGPAAATYVLATDIIVADMVDGQPLFEYQGPFRIVAPHDRRGARGVRMLQKLDVVRLRK